MDIKQIIGSILETCIKIAAVIFVVMFVYNTSIKAYDYGYRVFAEEPMTFGEGRTISIYVKSEDSVKDIGVNLQEKGLIRDANLFYVQELLSEYHGKIQPGIYDLNTSMKPEEMIAVMSAGYVEPGEEDDDGQ
ncbi:MAG: endolytic transglycosylase MltG [Butyrivibrio sp.]|nr:endolytic transglycosylase MltG [Butyrivibrio sp.]